MAGNIQMNPDQAEKWINDVNDLIEELKQCQNNVNTSVENIGRDSGGSIIDIIKNAVGELIDAATELMDKFGNLIDKVREVVQKGKALVEELAGIAGTIGVKAILG